MMLRAPCAGTGSSKLRGTSQKVQNEALKNIVGRHGQLLLNVVDLVMEAPTENVQQAKFATPMLILVQKFLHQMGTATTVGTHGVLPMLNVINHAMEAPTRNVHQTKNAGRMPLLAQLCFHQ